MLIFIIKLCVEEYCGAIGTTPFKRGVYKVEIKQTSLFPYKLCSACSLVTASRVCPFPIRGDVPDIFVMTSSSDQHPANKLLYSCPDLNWESLSLCVFTCHKLDTFIVTCCRVSQVNFVSNIFQNV